jgi:hypothetical protein
MNTEIARQEVLLRYPTAKVQEVGNALHKGGGYGFYIVVKRKALGRKGRTLAEAWRNARKSIVERMSTGIAPEAQATSRGSTKESRLKL